jgi:bis(5'-nucleosidyl)-tetraphosphatase
VKKEFSYGIVPLHFHENKWEVLIIQDYGGHWAFPKGHKESDESPQQAAERELKEETGLSISQFLLDLPLTETYTFTFRGEKIFKTVQYFLALVKGEIVVQEDEIKSCRWAPLKEAEIILSFKEGKNLLKQAVQFLSEKMELRNGG